MNGLARDADFDAIAADTELPEPSSSLDGADWRVLLRRAAARPGAVLSAAWALAKGRWCVATYPVRGRRLEAGRNLKVFGHLDVRGPGRVVLGDNVTVVGRVTPWTYDRNAVIEIGDNVILGETSFGCKQRISVGRDCILARASISDTHFHSTRTDRRRPEAPVTVSPVVIGDNVWVAQAVGILAGTRIGHNSVVSYGSVCMREYPADVVLMGNPAKVVSPVQKPPAAAPVTPIASGHGRPA